MDDEICKKQRKVFTSLAPKGFAYFHTKKSFILSHLFQAVMFFSEYISTPSNWMTKIRLKLCFSNYESELESIINIIIMLA